MPRTGTYMPDGFWKEFSNVETRLKPIIDDLGRMPTARELIARRLSSLSTAIVAEHGGFNAVGERLGAGSSLERRTRGYWKDFSNVEQIVLPIARRLGRMPTMGELVDCGLASFVQGIHKYHGGIGGVEKRMGLAERTPKKSADHWKDIANVSESIMPVVRDLGRMPTGKELDARKLSVIRNVIVKYHGGFAGVAAKLGLSANQSKKSRGYWQTFENVNRALSPVLLELGRMPTNRELVDKGLRKVSWAIVKFHGGFHAVAARLGLGPVTDDFIAVHADALTKIVPALDANPASLWPRMKRSWATRDLDAAVARYASDGSTDAFATLLSD